MADYSEFPTTPTGWQERQAGWRRTGRPSPRWPPRTTSRRKRRRRPRRPDPGPGLRRPGDRADDRRGPAGRALAQRRVRLGAAHRRRHRAAGLRTPQGPPPAVGTTRRGRTTKDPGSTRSPGLLVLPVIPTRSCPGGLLVTSRVTRLTSGHLVGDPRGDLRQHVVGQPGPVGGHRVLAGHRPQHDRVPVGAPVALDADRPDVGQQHDRALPDLAVQPGGGQLRAHDRVGLAQDVEPLLGHLADDPDAEARARGTAGARPSPRAAPPGRRPRGPRP